VRSHARRNGMANSCLKVRCVSGSDRIDARALAKLFLNFGACCCRRVSLLGAAFVAFLLLGIPAGYGQLRIVDYNTAGDARPSINTILAAIGAESVNGIVKQPDVFALEEQDSSASTTQDIVNILNTIYGAGTYARTTLDVGTTGAGRPTMIYNTKTVQLIGQQAVGTTSTSGAARQTFRAQFRPLGYTSTADFYVYASHYKASDTTSDANRRNVEAQGIRANSDALGQGASIIYAGDFNVYRSSEPMYQTLLGAGNGQAFDPLNMPGNWHDGAAFLSIHTQAPATSGSLVTGGVDDRFDFQLVTAELLDNQGLSYISGSYHAFGNTGTHQLNGAITTGSAAALQARLPGYTLQQATDVLTALTLASDHLPVVADYQIPAKMSVTLGNAPLFVIRGAALSLGFTVSNVAPVVAVNGADRLDYTFTGSGAVAGSGSGSDMALGNASAHTLSLNTSAAGLIAGSVQVHSGSQSVADGDFTGNLSLTVLDPSTPSFSLLSLQNNLVLDFGIVNPADGLDSISFSLANLVATAGFTAGLDFDGFVLSGNTAPFSTTLTLFSGLAAGTTRSFTFSFDPSFNGTFESIATLSFSDADLPGATARGDLTVILRATTIPEPSLLGCFAAANLVLIARRRRVAA